jgi:hypothetical protein
MQSALAEDLGALHKNNIQHDLRRSSTQHTDNRGSYSPRTSVYHKILEWGYLRRPDDEEKVGHSTYFTSVQDR